VWYFDSVRSGWLVGLAVVCAAHGAIAEPTPDPSLDPKNLKTLTADPLTGKADRIDGDETSGMVAFTFDDGPNPKTTPDVIDALEKYDVPATFFIARELADGFMVGSHSVTHPNLGTADGKVLDHEVDGSIRTLAVQANRPIGMFRPPYGSMNKTGRLRLKQLGLTEVQWSVDTMDWASHNAERLRRRTVSMIFKQNGGVVLMHDVKPITAKTITDILDDVEAENCKRLAAASGKAPIIPVSLHYFMRDGKTPRAIPAEVQKRTEAYKKALPARCAARPQPPAKDPPPPTK